MIIPTTDIARRETLAELVGAFRQSMEEIETAYRLLEGAQKRLQERFAAGTQYYFNVNDRNQYERTGEGAIKAVRLTLKRDAWAALVERMELKRVLSLKRQAELEKQIREGKDLPDITEEGILAMFEQQAANVETYLEEAVREVFDYLRPRRSGYKTNSEFEIGKRVILTFAVERGFTRGAFRVCYRRGAEISALDRVFAMLDGRGSVLKSHNGPLYDAITDSPDGTGETEYFKFKCFKNQNLHVEFKRPDLVARLNAVAGGARLRKEG